MNSNKNKLTYSLLPVIAILVFGNAFFFYVFPASFVNPFNVEWVFNQSWQLYDLATHAVAAMFYSNDIWRFPPGAMYNFGGESAPGIFYFASSPMLAIPFKVFQGVISVKLFQWIGIQIYLGFILLPTSLFILGVRQGFSLPASFYLLFVGSLSVPFLRVWNNDSLTWQFIIVLSITIFLSQSSKALHRALFWALLSILAAATNTYFLAMMAVFILSDFVINYRNSSRFDALTILLFPFCAILITQYLIGGFEAYPYMGTTGVKGESALFSANVFQFNDYFGYRYNKLSPLESWEGFNYAGAIPLLLFVAFLINFKKLQLSKGEHVLLAIGLFYFLLSLGSVIRIGGLELNLNLPLWVELKLGTFRSLGRFGWVTFYILLYFGAKTLNYVYWNFAKTEQLKRLFGIALVLLLILHFYDLNPLLQNVRAEAHKVIAEKLPSTFLLDAAKIRQRVRVVPAYDGIPEKQIPWAPLFKYSIENDVQWPDFNLGAARRNDHYTAIIHPLSAVNYNTCHIDLDATYVVRKSVVTDAAHCNYNSQVIFENDIYKVLNFLRN